ncbi:hypothetical protein SSP24_56670 [Streptomyces spinoverrucosus]|uniref:Uncharacterized protein n=1 Tax=Streptomyces spinoverrucosus TaxID=284043 RepID=A0A4Y3VLZ2_9ACTN|nr:hypothetical protein [Streptomyces spinoverrucosus]GEC08012.1 hypothetical protein SSP24_56670 [Streptomyces spinoverrucosus]GHB89177.1 hypothetical protein GCM10010397_71520 [Streptomyces spinoverrucosus]
MTSTKTAEPTEERVLPARIPLSGGPEDVLIGIGAGVAEAGLTVRHTTTSALMNELAEADADERLSGMGAKPLSQTFTDPRPCAAIADRLTFKGAPIRTRTDSHRPKATENEYWTTR